MLVTPKEKKAISQIKYLLKKSQNYKDRSKTALDKETSNQLLYAKSQQYSSEAYK